MTGPPRHTTYSLFFDLFVLGQRVRELLAVAMATSPLRAEEYAIYSVVFEDEAVSPTSMAAQLSMPLTTVVDAIRTMERRRHARRMPNPQDRRSYLVVLTGDGLRAHADAHDRFEVAYRAFVAELAELGGEPAARRHVAGLLLAAERASGSMQPVGSVPPSRPRASRCR
jgi:DNA-binding MarR family transcriptional regulator